MDDTELQEELARLHSASVGWALWCCGHRQDEAEDVVQTAYLKILDRSATFDGRSSLRTWLFGVIRRTAVAQQRRHRVRRLLLDRWLVTEPPATSPADPEAIACQSDRNRHLLRAVGQLATRQQQVLHLVFYQDLTVEEASRVMHVSLGTARTHFDRGKRRLREILAEEGASYER